MYIELVPKIYNTNLSYKLKDLLNNLIGVNLDDFVESIIISEEGDLYKVVNSVDPSLGVTNSLGNTAVAKTISNYVTGKSLIVITNSQLKAFSNELLADVRVANWSFNALNGLYTFIHEIGHAFDYKHRPNKTCKPSIETYRFSELIEYYHEIVLSEIGANINISGYVPLQFKQNSRHFFNQAIQSSINGLMAESSSPINLISETGCSNILAHTIMAIRNAQEAYIQRYRVKEKPTLLLGKKTCRLIRNWIDKHEKTYPNWHSDSADFENIVKATLSKFKLRPIVEDFDYFQYSR